MPARHHFTKTMTRKGLLKDLKSFSDLEQRISSLPSNKERGDAFEVFAEAYLATQKITQAAEVWPEQHIPSEVLRKHKLPERDLGADGVFSTTTGQLNAYQVKFRTGRPALTWDELGSFMGLTDQVDERVLFTNCDDLPTVMNERSGFYCIRGSDLDRLEESDFLAISDWLETGVVKLERWSPKPHQSEALDAILGGLRNNDHVTAVMACGTGKTLVALWLAERTEHKRIIVLVPSLALIRQTLHEWLRQTSWDSPQFLCVCSDPSVTKGADDNIIVQQSDLDFPVTTDAAEAREFLSRGTISVQVVFTTYQSSRVVGEAMEGLPAFDLGIFDEAHKTAGRESTNFAFALRDENLQISTRIFLTATPRHYDVRKRDKEGDLKQVFSMDDEETYGPIVYTLPFAEAARRGIICDYKVIISIVTSEMVNDDLLRHGEVVVDGEVINARQVAHQIALQKACEEHDLQKVFTFHTKVKAAREFTGDGGHSISSHLPSYLTSSVSGDMQTAKRERVMTAFKQADRAVLSNARCLTEGVDVPAVDMVAFMSPKKSKVDIVQATGRAMRKSAATGKTIGYVMVPLYVETAADETVEQALERTDFDDVADVLNALREQDDVLNDLIIELTVEKGRTGSFNDNRTRDRIEVLGPEVALEQLKHSINTMLLDRLGVSWDQRFGELFAYKAEHGDCNVPRSYARNTELAWWVKGQRRLYNTSSLDTERIKKLEDIGFVWDPHGAIWDEMYKALVTYETQHGDCNVPAHNYPQNPQLSNWVRVQRSSYDAGKLTFERIKRLEAIGFVWDPLSVAWEEMFEALAAYKVRRGDCNVPRSYAENPKLRVWVAVQRRSYHSNKLAPDRIERLENIGFVWDPFSAQWDEMYEALVAYRAENGDCNVPPNYAENPKLRGWNTRQRTLYNSKKLAPDRIERLENIGFVWDLMSELREEMYQQLVAYRAEYGDCNVPEGYAANPKLANWVNSQRTAYNSNKLTSDRVKRLEDIGFIWDFRSAVWEEMYTELLAYRTEHGNCNVPMGFAKNPGLATWVKVQRRSYNSNKLNSESIKRLQGIGFVWDPRSADWEEMYATLQTYKAEHGNCNVPQEYAENPKLGKWVARQRRSYSSNKLTQDRIKRLEGIGFVWDPSSATWEEMYATLVAYRTEHGHCKVPSSYAENPKLGKWVGHQRSFYNANKLNSDRIKWLEDIGFVWDPLSTVWEDMYAALVAYKEEHGDCNVPINYADNPRLGKWFGTQRTFYNNNKLNSDRIKRLEDIGCVWDRSSAAWEEMYAALVAYREEHGNCNVPQCYDKNPKLGSWVSTQRAFYKSNKLNSDRIRRLEDIGFEWSLRSTANEND